MQIPDLTQNGEIKIVKRFPETQVDWIVFNQNNNQNITSMACEV